MISNFPFNANQLRKASLKLTDRISDTIEKTENLDMRFKGLDIAAASIRFSGLNYTQLLPDLAEYNNSERYKSHRIMTVTNALELPEYSIMAICSEINLEYMSGALRINRELAQYVVNWREEHSDELAQAETPVEQLRNIRLAFRIIAMMYAVPETLKSCESYDMEHEYNLISDIMRFVINRSLIPGDGVRFLGQIAYVAKNLDKLSYEIAFKLYDMFKDDSYTLTDDDLKMLVAFENTDKLNNESTHYGVVDKELTFYGIPISWLDTNTYEGFVQRLTAIAIDGARTDLLITQPLKRAYTLAQFTDGVFNYALDESNNAIDFEHTTDKVIARYKLIVIELDFDLTEEQITTQMNEAGIPV